MNGEEQTARALAFLGLHRPGEPLVMPNPWDAGSARLLASLGFAALATTSSGFAATLGRLDGSITRDEALGHAAAVAAAVTVPVSADLENGFSADPAGVAETAHGARGAGLAGFSMKTQPAARTRRSMTCPTPPSAWPRQRRARTHAISRDSC